MPKGIAVDPLIRAYATRTAIEALRDGIPANTVAMTCGVRPRTLHRWLQWNRDAYQARIAAIESGRRFARGLTAKQLQFRRQQALLRLSPNKKSEEQ